jgi:hypothetical protein
MIIGDPVPVPSATSVLTFNFLLELPNSIQAIGEFTVFGLAQLCPGFSL